MAELVSGSATRCQHCYEDIRRLTSGTWVDSRKFTVCTKAPVIGSLVLHAPMPDAR